MSDFSGLEGLPWSRSTTVKGSDNFTLLGVPNAPIINEDARLYCRMSSLEGLEPHLGWDRDPDDGEGTALGYASQRGPPCAKRATITVGSHEALIEAFLRRNETFRRPKGARAGKEDGLHLGVEAAVLINGGAKERPMREHRRFYIQGKVEREFFALGTRKATT